MTLSPLLLLSPILGLSNNFWINFWQIFFGTIFSIALLWVVAQIWKKEDDEDEEQDKTDKKP